MKHFVKAIALTIGLSLFASDLTPVQAMTFKPIPLVTGQGDVVQIRSRRHRRDREIAGAILGGIIVGGIIAGSRHRHYRSRGHVYDGYYHGQPRRYHSRRYYSGRHYDGRYYGGRYYRRGYGPTYDLNGFRNER